MNSSSKICCDASIVVRWATNDPNAPIADLVRAWSQERRPLIAPSLIYYEVVNAVYQMHRANTLTLAEAEESLRLTQLLNIELVAIDFEIHALALGYAARFGLPATYDAHYLAIAERETAELWTADQRLFNKVRHQIDWIHLIPAR